MDNENKQLLGEMVELMIAENSMKDPKAVMIFLNERSKYYWERKPSYYNINEINKQILNDCYNYMRKNKENRVREKIPENKMVPLYTGIKEKNSDFDAMYNAYKEDFKRVSEGNKPKAIDFSAESGDFPASKNMDDLLSQTLEDREKELRNMQQHYNKDKEKAEKWLSSETIDNESVNNSDPPKLVIHDGGEREEKKVRFSISPETTNQIQNKMISPNIDSIIGRMKKKNNSEDMKEVINILKEILTTQKEMLALMKTNQSVAEQF